MKIILTGATGLVGEGVLLTTLDHPAVERVTVVGRRSCGRRHAKLDELIVADFRNLTAIRERLAGYDACFYCAGITSRGMTEAAYTEVTVETPLAFCRQLLELNPGMRLCHISGGSTDSSEQGRIMWARVKGRAENELSRLPFAGVYHFRPGLMQARPDQQNVHGYYKLLSPLTPVVRRLAPGLACRVEEVGQAMIAVAQEGSGNRIFAVRAMVDLAGTKKGG